MLLLIPYTLVVTGVPALMVVLYYYVYQYLLRKLQPRRNARQLLLFFLVAVLFTLAYMWAGIWLVVNAGKALQG